MKVTAFVGSARKKHTYQAAEAFLHKLRTYGDVEGEVVRLGDYNLKACRGCKVCMDKGEELCPLDDDRNVLIDKIFASDGIVFVSPNYSFNVSGLMKLFLDRLGFLFHRPCCFGKTAAGIVAQGIYGGDKIVAYFNFICNALGFNVVKGCTINSLEPMTEKGRRAIDRKIDKLSRRYYAQLLKKEYPTPSLFELMIFRMARTSRKIMLNEDFRDYTWCREKGWFESEYYYPVGLNPIKKIAGKLFDGIACLLTKNR